MCKNSVCSMACRMPFRGDVPLKSKACFQDCPTYFGLLRIVPPPDEGRWSVARMTPHTAGYISYPANSFP